MTNTSNRDAFMREFLRGTQPLTDDFRWKRLFNRAVVIGIIDDAAFVGGLATDQVYLAHLKSLTQRQGHGRVALAYITALTDLCDITMRVDAKPLEQATRPISPKKLQEIYAGFGFQKTGHDAEMIRFPRKNRDGAAFCV